ncbi:RsiV family protein [Helicobacter marmotae]|uniref:DUF3298 domain-containing protein n=1 Tax=Helicobacter marmotae TaxID=152490 RepID=A0A3D8I2G8_9HELI|nr:RsiV family protein [Helicobacter marmotae]RDU59176.1 DUF3298 domain-containing protein [Helicobacter marmotae]
MSEKKMRYISYVICVICVSWYFVGCQKAKKEVEFQYFNQAQFEKFLRLDSHERRTFVMRSDNNADKSALKAYAYIYHSPHLMLDLAYMDNGVFVRNRYEIDKVGFAKDKGILKLKIKAQDGDWLIFSQDRDLPLNEVRSFFASFYNKNDSSNTQYHKVLVRSQIVCTEKLKKQVCDKINRALGANEDKATLLHSLAQEVAKDYDKSITWNIQDIHDQSVVYIDDKIIVLSDSIREYNGGAHGSTLLKMQAFDIHNAQSLPQNASTLFREGSLSQVRTLLVSELEKHYSKDTFFEFEEIDIPEVFFVSDEGIVFVWQEYDIAPYSAGIIKVSLPFSALKPYVQTHSPYGYLFE